MRLVLSQSTDFIQGTLDLHQISRDQSLTLFLVAKTACTAQDTLLSFHVSGHNEAPSLEADHFSEKSEWAIKTPLTTHFVSTSAGCCVTSLQGDKCSTSPSLAIATSRKGLFKVSSFPVPPPQSSRSNDREEKGSSGASGPPQ